VLGGEGTERGRLDPERGRAAAGSKLRGQEVNQKEFGFGTNMNKTSSDTGRGIGGTQGGNQREGSKKLLLTKLSIGSRPELL